MYKTAERLSLKLVISDLFFSPEHSALPLNIPIMNFPRYVYRVDRVSTKNTLTIDIRNINFKNKQDKDYFCPRSNSIFDCRHCNECVQFLEWPTTFVISNNFIAFTIPPPIIFAKNNCSYFNNFVNKFKTINDREYTSDIDAEYQNLIRSYHDFVNESSFRGGYLLKQLSGKNSFYKLYCLGGNGNCIRGTLIVCPNLMPNEVSVPRNIYNELQQKGVEYVILNRDPSINTRCLYVSTYKYHDDSPTIKISQFVLRGLHGDQDGDEVNLYYVTTNDNTYFSNLAKCELKRATWNDGFRHDIMGNPRYTFSQQQDLMLYLYDAKLSTIDKFWGSLARYSIQKKKRVFWDLASFTHRKEADDFLRMFLKFCAGTDPGLARIKDLISGVGIMDDVVKSGAKGTATHIEQYKKLLGGQSINAILNDSISTFNKYVKANHEMKVCGRQQSGSNHIYQNVYMAHKVLFCQDTAIVSDVFECELSSCLLFRPNVVEFAILNHIDRAIKPIG
jgi:hypothetical protein